MARLKVLVCNQLAGGMQAQAIPATLRRQGDMLLQALLTDLRSLAGVELLTVAGSGGEAAAEGAERAAGADAPDARLACEKPAPPYVQPTGLMRSRLFGTRAGLHAGIYADPAMLAADAVWPLALESRGELEGVTHAILDHGRIVLGSTPGALAVAASKLRLAQVLEEGGVATVATCSPYSVMPHDGGPWVVKPDDGAGCLHTRLFSDRDAALAWVHANTVGGDGVLSYVLQPFVAGRLGSLSLICCDGMALLLACNQERVAMRDNRFQVLGSIVNGLPDEDGALARLAQQVAAAIPGLWGYVGVDFVLGDRGAVVLDVNPRLTTAYAGLHAAIGCNPAGLVLDLLQQPLAALAPVAPQAADRRRAVTVDLGP